LSAWNSTKSSAVQAPRCSAVRWTPDHVRQIALDPAHTSPLIGGGFARVADDLDVWDAWPVQDDAGHPFELGAGVGLWMALGAPRFPDPDQRHAHARIHLLQLDGTGWTPLGPAMPAGFSPGSREWSGSAVLDQDGRSLSLYFTAAGRRGEAEPGFLQRLYVAPAVLTGSPNAYRLDEWRSPEEIVEADPSLYMATDTEGGGPGTIKAFRDPAYFRDPRSGARYLFFAGSLAGSSSAFNGVIGAAVSGAGETGWRLLPPIVSADGLNNELERPHVVWHDGLYYLFWSTQRQVFDPAGPVGPTGLYGMVSDRLDGGWVPLNGTGLVVANPPQAPAQAYSWLVLPDLRVTSFVDDWGESAGDRPRRFGGSFAPWLTLELAGPNARLAG
jgi:levansucrase